MTDSVEKASYSVDTSAFLDWQLRYYPADVFFSLLDKIDGLLKEKRIFAPALVKEEIEASGGANLAKWAKSHSGLFVPLDEVLAAAQAVQNRFPGLMDPKAEYEEADAYVIGLAQVRGAVVITGETSVAEKSRPKRSHYIPDVCRELGISCFNFLGLMRREKWRF
ncbi:MAG: hypothetical protein A3G87_01445 [Omnitrophica bacterium RIFCSPLOWO2_12_FULL_50_11]|nr:MAG: hypothetical protein A3G87_01445 [Omnitrophica bacterium RIFCSPLOWO2_12_FULL_50_11]